MKKIALITIHGMVTGKEDDKKGNHFPNLEKNLRHYLKEDWSKVSFQNVQYSSILEDPQEELWKHVKNGNKVNCHRLRRFALSGLGDASAIGHRTPRTQHQYIDVRKKIQEALSKAYSELGEDPSKPVVIIAHSPEGVNLIWTVISKITSISRSRRPSMLGS